MVRNRPALTVVAEIRTVGFGARPDTGLKPGAQLPGPSSPARSRPAVLRRTRQGHEEFRRGLRAGGGRIGRTRRGAQDAGVAAAVSHPASTTAIGEAAGEPSGVDTWP